MAKNTSPSAAAVPTATLIVSIIAMTFMAILIHNNSGSLLAVFSSNVLILANNASNITNGINGTQLCQSDLNTTHVLYEICLNSGYIECSTTSAEETQIEASLSVVNLTNTRNRIQWACSNRSDALNAEMAAFSAVDSNVTSVQNGTVLITVQGGAYSITTAYEWKRLLIGNEFRLDLLVLPQWTVAPIVTIVPNATITFNTFTPSLCLYQNQLPLLGTYFSGAIIANFEGLCSSIVFHVLGSVSGGGVKLISDLGIYF